MKKTIMIINSLFFILALFIGGILFWIFPKETISEEENRNLAIFPKADKTTIFSGEFERKFEEFYNDHFVYRNMWISISDQLKELRGYQDQEVKIIMPTAPNLEGVSDDEDAEDEKEAVVAIDKHLLEDNKADSQQLISKQNIEKEKINEQERSEEKNVHLTVSNENSIKHLENDKAEEEKISRNENINDDFNKIKGVVIANNRVIQNFSGSKKTLKPFADLINRYQSELGDDVKIYAMLIPSGSDFYLPTKVNHGILKEKENIDIFPTLLNDKIIPVNAYAEIAPHKDEYIMYKTDHHWTGLGAYYAYRAFAKVAGFSPLELSDMQHVKASKTFLGSLYNYTHEKSLTQNPDLLEYYKIPTKTTAVVYKDNSGKGIPATLYYEKTTGYGVFLGGDYALMHIQAENQSKRKILIIKDSFGNALSTYLPTHYSDVYIVDYRYFKQSIPELMRKHDIKELLYAHNTFAANSRAAVKYGKRMLK
ncbi:hypothetical protein A4G19_04895 [Pasteurellaceae bacterium Macca]|nr:hypothetical protein [Pasteurellaceae bacterium Macca]